jgi:hypothetical protein
MTKGGKKKMLVTVGKEGKIAKVHFSVVVFL